MQFAVQKAIYVNGISKETENWLSWEGCEPWSDGPGGWCVTSDSFIEMMVDLDFEDRPKDSIYSELTEILKFIREELGDDDSGDLIISSN